MATSALAKLRAPAESKIVRDLPPRIAHWAPPGGTMVIPTPMEVDGLIRAIPKGKLATLETIRAALAGRHDTTIACPLVTGIAIGISARAAAEEEAMGARTVAPWWRVLKSDGTLNPKAPGGVAEQRRRLMAEGFRCVAAGRKGYRVQDFAASLARI